MRFKYRQLLNQIEKHEKIQKNTYLYTITEKHDFVQQNHIGQQTDSYTQTINMLMSTISNKHII